VIDQLLLATLMVVITVLIHGAGIAWLARMLRFDPSSVEDHHHFSPRHAFLSLSIVLALFSLHGIEIWLYGGLYLLLGWPTAFFVTIVARLRR
jgi:hypothetical protein